MNKEHSGQTKTFELIKLENKLQGMETINFFFKILPCYIYTNVWKISACNQCLESFNIERFIGMPEPS